MNYSIIWLPNAIQQFAAIWLARSNRNVVTAAAHAIDLALVAAPHAGILIFDTLYEYTHRPIAIEYEVVEADCRVLVLAGWDTALGRPTPSGN